MTSFEFCCKGGDTGCEVSFTKRMTGVHMFQILHHKFKNFCNNHKAKGGLSDSVFCCLTKIINDWRA